MDSSLYKLVNFIKGLDSRIDKARLQKLVQKEFSLVKDRSVFYTDTFAIRFSSSKSASFSNTVLSLSSLQKYDDFPFVVCLNTPNKNYLFLANTTFLAKVSHSSQELRKDNIRGSINGSDIVKVFNGIENKPENFAELFAIHSGIGFNGNLARLVEATNNISPSGDRYSIQEIDRGVILQAPRRTTSIFIHLVLIDRGVILQAPRRAKDFVVSVEYSTLKSELDRITLEYKNEIILASLIDNVNIRGRVIEYIIAGEDDRLRDEIINALRKGTKRIPGFRTKNTLGDFVKIFDKYDTATDIKTKVMTLSSAPKAYNLDKMLEFLAKEKSVFMFYFVGVMSRQVVGQALVSMFQNNLRDTTHILKHWAGRNSRGAAQLSGRAIDTLMKEPDNDINVAKSQAFLESIMKL